MLEEHYACGSWFTNSSRVLPTSRVVYQPINSWVVVQPFFWLVKASYCIFTNQIWRELRNLLIFLMILAFLFRDPYELWKAAFSAFFPPEVKRVFTFHSKQYFCLSLLKLLLTYSINLVECFFLWEFSGLCLCMDELRCSSLLRARLNSCVKTFFLA